MIYSSSSSPPSSSAFSAIMAVDWKTPRVGNPKVATNHPKLSQKPPSLKAVVMLSRPSQILWRKLATGKTWWTLPPAVLVPSYGHRRQALPSKRIDPGERSCKRELTILHSGCSSTSELHILNYALLRKHTGLKLELEQKITPNFSCFSSGTYLTLSILMCKTSQILCTYAKL